MDHTVLGRTGYGVCHPPLYFVNENVHLIMSPHFLTHKDFTVKLSLVKIVFIGGSENRIMGYFSLRTLVQCRTWGTGSNCPGPPGPFTQYNCKQINKLPKETLVFKITYVLYS